MPGQKGGENSRKAAGNAKKAEVAAAKAAAENQQRAAAETVDWDKGAKDNSKKAKAEEKAAEAARKKAEKDALLREEEASLASKPKGEGKKGAAKKKAAPARGLDLGQLEDADPAGETRGELNASGIDNALDALSLTTAANDKLDRHPERRFKAAYAVYEEKRLEEMKDDKGLRRNQKVAEIRREFEKSPENPFNQAMAGSYDMTKGDAAELREQKRQEVETRLGGA